jgi:type 1 glutamine amidotransferase
MDRKLGIALGLFSFLCACLHAPRALADDDAGFKPLFDEKTLESWDGDPKFWSVAGGAITGQTTRENPTRGNTFIIWRGGELDDFVLRLDYRITGGNSGIQYRSFENEKEWGKWVVGGYQADFEAGDTYSGILYGERYRGMLAPRGKKTVIGDDHKPKEVGSVGDPKEIQSKIKKEDWNSYEVTAQGYSFVHKINGVVTSECTDEDKAMRRRSGILALQLHAGPPMKVEFRNIRLKRLPLGDKKKVVFVAGKPSHGYGSHEHNAGSLLLKKCLDESHPGILSTVYQSGWPWRRSKPDGAKERDNLRGADDLSAFDNADAVVIYCDGGGGHPARMHLEGFDKLMKKGVGLGCIHYGVEVPKGKEGGGEYFLDWIGGYFETDWSVNPHWTIKNAVLAKDHPVTRGVQPFEINDEWYFFMRFRPEMKGVTPILSAVAPPETMSRGDGSHSGNKHVRESVKRGDLQALCWAAERDGGGRGFGFTGGHVHWNWGNDDFRKLILNAISWIAKAEVPEGGVSSKTPSREDLEANQDEPKPSR